jgi:excisionase family DNA binding protein
MTSGLSGSPLFENQDNCNKDEKDFSLESVRWLTSSEAAQYLRVSISSLKMMVYRGQIKVRKLGRRNRFLREELERLFISPSFSKEK